MSPLLSPHIATLILTNCDLPRARLKGTWGIVDVRDCAHAATLLSTRDKLIDPQRIAIRGRSSGGFTVLAAVCDYPEVFTAATSLYGISDLVKLEEFTHKFESQYCNTLLGGTSKEVPEVYRERSPVHKADKIKAPLLVRLPHSACV